MAVTSREVLLLKAPGEDDEDKYESILTKNGFTVKHLQVLDFQYINLSILKEKLSEVDSYSGIIFTSQRGVIATKICLNGAKMNVKWKQKDNFVIGESTHDLAYKELDLDCKGQDSGNANHLSELIIHDNFKLPFLFPCGNLRKETLGQRLSEYNIKLDAITVYETVKSPRLESDFIELTSNLKNLPEYLVYFSPSGLKFTKDILKDFSVELNTIKLVAIGPSTKEAIENENLDVYAVAAKPTETELLRAILKHDQIM
ncbi:Uroporphyrinogen III synthase 1 [Carabus blaptoides fortunei]